MKKNYYQNNGRLSSHSKPKFNGVYWRYNLPKIKDGAYVINRDELKSIETHWIALYVNSNNIIYFDSFEVEHIRKEIKKFIGKENIRANIYRIQANDSIMCGYFCIEFINFMPKDKILLDFQNLFSPNEYGKNGKIMLNTFNN